MKEIEVTQQIYDHIKEEILTEHLKVHEKISERIICEQFNVSRTVVRIAVTKLKDDGWLYVKAKSGTYVSPINQKEMMDSFTVRMILEPNIIPLAIPYITDEDLMEMKNNCAAMAKSDREQFQRLELANHHIIEKRCENTLIVEIVSDLMDSYHRMTAKTSHLQDRREASIREWEKIIMAIESKNGELAKQCMIQHILNATDVFWEAVAGQ